MPQLTIRSPEAIRLIRELAALEGRSMTAVVGDAVREKYLGDYPAACRESRITYWLERGQQLREHMERVNPEWLAKDPTEDLYDDEPGLPK